jgi:hypothetical protein
MRGRFQGDRAHRVRQDDTTGQGRMWSSGGIVVEGLCDMRASGRGWSHRTDRRHLSGLANINDQVVSRSLVVWLKASAFEASYAATRGYLVGQQLNGSGFNAFAGRCLWQSGSL